MRRRERAEAKAEATSPRGELTLLREPLRLHTHERRCYRITPHLFTTLRRSSLRLGLSLDKLGLEEHLLQLATLVHLQDNVAPADEFTLQVKLGDCGP